LKSPALALLFLVLPVSGATGFDLCLPTGNDALLKPEGDVEFFQPTVEGTVESGRFGCVRSDGRRFHEGIDIKCRQRDHRGESTDPVHAVSEGAVAFINAKPGWSNYGRYIVLQHQWDGVEAFTLYAHLRDIADGLAVGQPVAKAQVIGTMGRSTNTREGISRDRAHLHFEINFMLNTNFARWYAKRDPKASPFGNFNGQNFVGIDPAALLRAFAGNPKLSFAEHVAQQPVAFTVLLDGRQFSWLARHPEQLVPSSAPPVAYEIGVTAWGVPVTVWSRETTEGRRLPVVRLVNETELARSNCRGLVRQGKRGWELSARGREWVELLTFGR
jgi:hypothetical protein